MDIVMLLIVFSFTMAEYFCLLHALDVKVRRYYILGFGLAALIAIYLVFGEKIGVGSEGYYGIRVAFVTVIFMIDKKHIGERFQNAFLVALMKDCLLLAVETWCAELLANYYSDNIYCFLYFSAELLLVFLFGLILRKIVFSFNKEKVIRMGSLLDYIIVIGCFDIFTCIWYVYYEILSGNYTDFKDRLYTSFAAVSLLLLEINLLYKKWLTEQVQRHARAEHELYETQKHYFQSLLEKEAETKKYRHDMNNHMICIKSLLDEGNYDELQHYIDELYDRTSYLVNKGYKTGNSILDALTNYYADSMGKEIEFSVKGNIVKKVDIDDTALSSIYSNMLVNAIEAQKHIDDDKDKFIHVSLKEGDKYAQLIVKNSMENERIENLDNIKTTKTDKQNHGFGIANIRKNVAEHNGKLAIEAQDYEFCVKATLPLLNKCV